MGYGFVSTEGKTKKESKENFELARVQFSIRWLNYGEENGYLVDVSGKITFRKGKKWITAGHFDK